MGDFAFIGRHIAFLVKGAAMDVGIEVAIGAFGRAERPMHIDAEQVIAGLRHSLLPIMAAT
jgi:hypothetical protein